MGFAQKWQENDQEVSDVSFAARARLDFFFRTNGRYKQLQTRYDSDGYRFVPYQKYRKMVSV